MLQSQYCSQLPMKHCYLNLPSHVSCCAFCPSPPALLVSPQPQPSSTLHSSAFTFPGYSVQRSNGADFWWASCAKRLFQPHKPLIHPHWTLGTPASKCSRVTGQKHPTDCQTALKQPFDKADSWQIPISSCASQRLLEQHLSSPEWFQGRGGTRLTRRTGNSLRQGKGSKGLNSVKHLKSSPYTLLCAAVSWNRGSKVWCTHQLLSESSNIRQFCERSSINPFDVMSTASSPLKWLTLIPNIQYPLD